MPQGRRKVPFSAKQKKSQLQQKREQKRGDWSDDDDDSRRGRRGKEPYKLVLKQNSSETESAFSFGNYEVRKINQQPGRGKHDRYQLHLRKETKEDLEKRKKQAMLPIVLVPEKSLEVDIDEVYLPGSVLDMPKRQDWSYSMSKQKLDEEEQKYFRQYLSSIESKFPMDELSYFELNLETWRQLWRVLEMSDILLIIVDIRYPALHFSPALYDHVVKDLKKDIILVLNKIDLVSPGLVVAWKHYFLKKFPELKVVCFTSFTGGGIVDPTKHKINRKRRPYGNLKAAAYGSKRLLELCEKIVNGAVDLSSWNEKIEQELVDKDDEGVEPIQVDIGQVDTGYYEHVRYKDGVLTIGCVGHPNVGKSSLINGLMGKKVVSVSRTPGHTKHFQTIFLTPTVKLCDCPGLIFPSKCPQPLQILSGCYPIAQVREPYAAIQYTGERVPLPIVLKLTHQDPDISEGEDQKWSAFDICDAWASKRGFLTAKAARHDVYRAANNLLRMVVEGKICVYTTPADYTEHKDEWSEHPEVQAIVRILDQKKTDDCEDQSDDQSSSDDDNEDSEDSGDNASEEESDDSSNSPAPKIQNRYMALDADDA